MANDVTLLVLLGFVPATWLLFALLPARRAMIVGIVAGWLLLPVATHQIVGFPEVSKTSVLVVALYSAVAAFDRQRLRCLRPGWVDLPMAALIASAGAASLSSGYGWYDAGSASLNRILFWLAPYVLGRIYCSSLAGLRELAIGFVCGGVAYVPLCAFESWAGPVLHQMLYGYRQHSLNDVYRFGGWRPSVFMTNGLVVGVWMAACTLTAAWLWWSRAMLRLWNASMAWWALLLLVTTILVRSVNGWVLLGIGAMVLVSIKRGHAVALLLLAMLPLGYVSARVVTGWSGKPLVRLALQAGSIERAHSLQFRMKQEHRLMKKAWQRPLLGWGGWGRWRIFDESGRDISISDSAWIVAFGQAGLLGVGSLMAVLLTPALTFYWRWPAARWPAPDVAPASGMATVLLLVAVDLCFNAQMTPMYLVAAGGVTGLRPDDAA